MRRTTRLSAHTCRTSGGSMTCTEMCRSAASIGSATCQAGGRIPLVLLLRGGVWNAVVTGTFARTSVPRLAGPPPSRAGAAAASVSALLKPCQDDARKRTDGITPPMPLYVAAKMADSINLLLRSAILRATENKRIIPYGANQSAISTLYLKFAF